MVIDVGELDKRWLMDFEGALSKVLLIDGSDAGQIRDVLEEISEKVERLPREKRDKLVELLHTILVGVGVAEEGNEELLKVEDLKKLKLLHRKSVSVESVEEFRRILREIRR